VLGPGRAVGGVCHIAATIAAPGVIRHTGTLARLTVGEWDGAASERVAAFVEAARHAGIDVVHAADIGRAVWEKFVFLAPFSGITTLARQPIGPLRADADARWAFRAAVAEAVAVAGARGIAFAEDQVDRVMSFVDGLPADMKSSMLGDLQRGARLELPWLSGAVVRLGEQHGVATPVHRTVVAALKSYAEPAADPA
jgi:2-dehydropantoate 2-reductase